MVTQHFLFYQIEFVAVEFLEIVSLWDSWTYLSNLPISREVDRLVYFL